VATFSGGTWELIEPTATFFNLLKLGAITMLQNNLIHVHHNKPFTDSFVISIGVSLKHAVVLKTIRKYENDFKEFGRVSFENQSFETKGGVQNREICELNEDQATYLITLFRNSEKVREFKIQLVKEFRNAINEIQRLQEIINNPDRKTALIEKRKAGSAMCDSLQFVRELLGKETDAIKYGNEYKFCWRALTGAWDKQDESTLDAYDLRLLEKIRNHNTVLIALHPIQKDRKQMLDDFVTLYRSKYPRLKLVN
jgi:phage regulator Rha-like protein